MQTFRNKHLSTISQSFHFNALIANSNTIGVNSIYCLNSRLRRNPCPEVGRINGLIMELLAETTADANFNRRPWLFFRAHLSDNPNLGRRIELSCKEIWHLFQNVKVLHYRATAWSLSTQVHVLIDHSPIHYHSRL